MNCLVCAAHFLRGGPARHKYHRKASEDSQEEAPDFQMTTQSSEPGEDTPDLEQHQALNAAGRPISRACYEKPQPVPFIQGVQHPVISLTAHLACLGGWGSPTVRVKRRINYRTKRCAKDAPPPNRGSGKASGEARP